MKHIPDLLLIAGTAAIAYGSWLVYEPAGFIVGGCIVFILGARISMKATS